MSDYAKLQTLVKSISASDPESHNVIKIKEKIMPKNFNNADYVAQKRSKTDKHAEKKAMEIIRQGGVDVIVRPSPFPNLPRQKYMLLFTLLVVSEFLSQPAHAEVLQAQNVSEPELKFTLQTNSSLAVKANQADALSISVGDVNANGLTNSTVTLDIPGTTRFQLSSRKMDALSITTDNDTFAIKADKTERLALSLKTKKGCEISLTSKDASTISINTMPDHQSVPTENSEAGSSLDHPLINPLLHTRNSWETMRVLPAESSDENYVTLQSIIEQERAKCFKQESPQVCRSKAQKQMSERPWRGPQMLEFRNEPLPHSSQSINSFFGRAYSVALKQRRNVLERIGGEEGLANMIVVQLLYHRPESHPSIFKNFALVGNELKSTHPFISQSEQRLTDISGETIQALYSAEALSLTRNTLDEILNICKNIRNHKMFNLYNYPNFRYTINTRLNSIESAVRKALDHDNGKVSDLDIESQIGARNIEPDHAINCFLAASLWQTFKPKEPQPMAYCDERFSLTS